MVDGLQALGHLIIGGAGLFAIGVIFNEFASRW